MSGNKKAEDWVLGFTERVMGLEPTTATLATWRSTTELHPQSLDNRAGLGMRVHPALLTIKNYKSGRGDFKGEAPVISATWRGKGFLCRWRPGEGRAAV